MEAAREARPQYYPLFLTALRGGLRRGELVALRWGDFQFGQNGEDANRYILVLRNYVYGRFTSTKSKKPRREPYRIVPDMNPETGIIIHPYTIEMYQAE